MPRPLMIYLVLLTSVGWAINLAVELLSKGGDPSVNGIFAIVVGALFALGRKGSANTGPKTPAKDPDDPEGGKSE